MLGELISEFARILNLIVLFFAFVFNNVFSMYFLSNVHEATLIFLSSFQSKSCQNGSITLSLMISVSEFW
ncbi:Uncharacterised protein, partial [Mycoplasmopsis edwardii]